MTPAKPSLLSRSTEKTETTPCPQDLPQQQFRPPFLLSNSSEREKSQKQRPYSISRQPSLLQSMNPPMKSLSAPSHPTSAIWTTSSSLLERITVQGSSIFHSSCKSPKPKAPIQHSSSSPTSSSNQPEPDPDVKFIPASGDPANSRRQHQVNSEGEESEEGSKRCHRPSVNEGLFPWKGTASVL